MKRKVGRVGAILFLVVFVIYLSVTAISDLTNKEDAMTVRIDQATTILEVKHAINGIIPTGTEYYFIGVTAETGDAYIIKGPKKWVTENFTQDCEAVNADGIVITGLRKRVSDYKVSNELADRTSGLNGIQLPYSSNYCIDLNYKVNAFGKLILLVFSFVIAICIYVVGKRKEAMSQQTSKVLSFVLIVVLIVWLMLLLRVLR